MVITGNFQISSAHLSLGRDVTFPSLPSSRDVEAFKALSVAMHSSCSPKGTDGPLAIIQLSHAGRQSPRFIGGRLGTLQQPLSPSSRRVGDDTRGGFLTNLTNLILFQKPRVISRKQIGDVVDAFVLAAKLTYEAGFDGVQVHAAHGCGFGVSLWCKRHSNFLG